MEKRPTSPPTRENETVAFSLKSLSVASTVRMLVPVEGGSCTGSSVASEHNIPGGLFSGTAAE